jgi:hypothetical protein
MHAIRHPHQELCFRSLAGWQKEEPVFYRAENNLRNASINPNECESVHERDDHHKLKREEARQADILGDTRNSDESTLRDDAPDQQRAGR